MIFLPKKLQSILFYISEKSNIETGFILAGDNNIIERIFQLTNKNNSSTSFHIKQDQLKTVGEYCKKNNLEIIGFFHSHVKTTAYPSKQDLKAIENQSYVWFIYSKLNKNMFAYKYDDSLESLEIVLT